MLPDGQLVAFGACVPQGRIPDGPWVPLIRWMGVELPRAIPAARATFSASLTFCRAYEFRQPSVLLTSVNCWKTLADDAPQVRLDRWRFAVAADDRVIVHGQPLPSLPGHLLVDYEGIAVAAGWSWSPAIEPAVVRELFELEQGDLALWYADGSWERVPGNSFVRASRAGIRASVEGRKHGRT